MEPYLPQNLSYPGSGQENKNDDGVCHFDVDGTVMHFNSITNELVPESECGCFARQ